MKHYRNILRGKLRVCKRENLEILFFVSEREVGYTVSLAGYHPTVRMMRKCDTLSQCIEELELMVIDVRDRYYEEAIAATRFSKARMHPRLINPGAIDDGIN